MISLNPILKAVFGYLKKVLNNPNKRIYHSFHQRSGASRLQLISFTLGFSLSICYITYAGLTRADLMTLGKKKIALFGDCHFGENQKAGSVKDREKQYADFADALKESTEARGKENLHIFFEEVPLINRQKNKDVLEYLEDAVAETGLSSITTESVEIRNVSGAAHGLLLNNGIRSVDTSKSYAENCPALDKITFKDVFDEFDRWIEFFKEFRMAHENELIFTGFDYQWEWMIDNYSNLIKLVKKHNIAYNRCIMEFARAISRDWYTRQYKPYWGKILKGIKGLEEPSEYTLNNSIALLILDVSSTLLDFHLFKRVYEYQGTHIAIVAGCDHANALLGLLYDQGATVDIHYQDTDRGDSYDNPDAIILLSKEQYCGQFLLPPKNFRSQS